ncbi:hypothetical protein S7711_09580 [Stachybotrys chartarum IBT 7711]|uniref:Transcription factor domain-containing protein n=1 Tax=Stachybotrys chartarum (strain CBS 109288 / IBT 7711) TaxID=1280523 RepID=A0A084AUU8_STACB|nr:hypothetical protein S7711_09580 [Stachybotrys chartarum IBT 7711]
MVDDSLSTSRDAAALETHAEKTTPHFYADSKTSKAEQNISNLTGLRITRDYLNATQPDSLLRQESWLPDTFRPWLSTCLKVYFGRFHERWPVIHAPIFNENAETPLTVGTLAIIGSWQDNTSESKKLALEIQKLLLQKLLEDMEPYLHPDNQLDWPYKLYQVSILNIIFAVETSFSSPLPDARRLLDRVVASFRMKEIMTSCAVERHQQIKFPSTDLPWLRIGQERWKRLVDSLFKVDAYMSFVTHQDAFLNIEEMDIGIPSTFAIWNAHVYMAFYERLDTEPRDRQELTLRDVASNPPIVAPSGVLLEDIQLGLFALASKIKDVQQSDDVEGKSSFRQQLPSLFNQLKYWKSHIDVVGDMLAQANFDRASAGFLVRAYAGGEVSSNDSESIIMGRIRSLRYRTVMLYHLLSIQLHFKIESHSLAWPALVQLASAGGTVPVSKTWLASTHAQAVLRHSLAVIDEHGTMLAPLSLHADSLDPLACLALSIARIMIKSWFACSGSLDTVHHLEV